MSIFKHSWEHKLRQELELPFVKKSLFFYFAPLFFLVSFTLNTINFLKRRLFLKKNRDDILVITVGNIILGGTGKTPVVQSLALQFLRANYQVAIASRGMKKKGRVFVSSDKSEDISFLSDENREHFEVLKYFQQKENLPANFYIFQGKDRLLSFLEFKSSVVQKKKDAPSVFIIDDGLQNYACPRSVSLSLWDPYLLLHSPPFALPLGPYREGFGRQSIRCLLQESADFRLWSRWHPSEALSSYQGKVEKSLGRFSLEKNAGKDVILKYQMTFWEIAASGAHRWHLLDKKEKLEISGRQKILVVTGIAKPERLRGDLERAFAHNPQDFEFYHLADHAFLDDFLIKKIAEAKVCLFTLKDLYRWVAEKKFCDSLKEKIFFGMSIEVEFCNFSGNALGKEFLWQKNIEKM